MPHELRDLHILVHTNVCQSAAQKCTFRKDRNAVQKSAKIHPTLTTSLIVYECSLTTSELVRALYVNDEHFGKRRKIQTDQGKRSKWS